MIHCPRANLANHGFPKAPEILEAGASVGLGCDGAAPSNLDIFDEMKVLRYSMLAYWGLPSFNPVVMTCPTLLKMASQGGANAIGHGDILGSVKEGKKADCKKIFGLMGLGAKKGHEVTFTFEGADEEAACEAVSKFMQENL